MSHRVRGLASAATEKTFPAHDLLYRVSMESKVHMHDVVALLEDVPARHFETGRPLLLRRGQVGTIVEGLVPSLTP